MIQSQLLNYSALIQQKPIYDVLNEAYLPDENDDYDYISMQSGSSIASENDASEAYEEMMDIIMSNNQKKIETQPKVLTRVSTVDTNEKLNLPKLNKHSYFKPFSVSRASETSSYLLTNNNNNFKNKIKNAIKDGMETKMYVPANTLNNKTPVTVTTSNIDGHEYHTITYELPEKQINVHNEETLKEYLKKEKYFFEIKKRDCSTPILNLALLQKQHHAFIKPSKVSPLKYQSIFSKQQSTPPINKMTTNHSPKVVNDEIQEAVFQENSTKKFLPIKQQTPASRQFLKKDELIEPLKVPTITINDKKALINTKLSSDISNNYNQISKLLAENRKKREQLLSNAYSFKQSKNLVSYEALRKKVNYVSPPSYAW